ncbi:glycosyltransferase family 4 protein [Psychroflexus sp. ALD_RP9]|uniref:glycosyltransferase family 4 protein n=1 Tax=Psychroflexus sp. ALD_RP9 TaxID=2777186 RepID=UPI001A8FDFDB|nr:glycosyltransferase family 4 protein [Psychroflexus sp. ALD_RP9]QSS98023.1 glycosyltransferase family 4 protein [Psychroflexus sp. ALD_RP9]
MRRKKLVLGITISGSTPLIRGQAKYFKNCGYDVYLMCPKDEKSIAYCKEEGCTLLPVRIERYINPLKDIATVFSIFKILRKLKPDVINVGTPKMGLLGAIGAFLAKVPKRIYTCRGLRYEHELGLMRKLLVTTEKIPGKLSHNIICISPSVKDRALKDNIFETKKVIVFKKGSSNGINLNKFSQNNVSREEILSLKHRYDLSNKFVFGFVGRLIDRKGINELYKAFDELSLIHPNFILILIGKSDSSQLYDKSLVSKIVAHNSILWLGWQDNIPLWLSLFDVFVMPAWWEGFGNSYLEAAAMGKPVIGTNATGCKDAIKKDFNGSVVPIKEVKPLKNAMLTYYENNSLREEHGKNGLHWVKNFNPEDIWNEQKKLYEN